MGPLTASTGPLDAFIGRAHETLESDARIVAAWIEGSFASGEADAWSDVDLHVAVSDDDWDAVVDGRLALVETLGPVLGHIDATLPGGAHMVAATLAGPLRLDLFLEPAGRLAAARGAVRVLFDRRALTEVFSSADLTPVSEQVRAEIARLLRGYFFGAMWPVRLWGREEWGTLLMNAVTVVYQFLVPAIFAQEQPGEAFRPPYHNERRLSPDRRRDVDALVGAIAAAFRGIERGEPDRAALRGVHARLVGALFAELRAASAAHGVAYPDAAEREMRAYFRRELGIQPDA